MNLYNVPRCSTCQLVALFWVYKIKGGPISFTRPSRSHLRQHSDSYILQLRRLRPKWHPPTMTCHLLCCCYCHWPTKYSLTSSISRVLLGNLDLSTNINKRKTHKFGLVSNIHSHTISWCHTHYQWSVNSAFSIIPQSHLKNTPGPRF